MNIYSETKDGQWRPFFRNTRIPYWFAPSLMMVFFGFIAIAQTISIFVMGYEPRLVDWAYYAFNILAAIAGVVDLLMLQRKRRQSEQVM